MVVMTVVVVVTMIVVEMIVELPFKGPQVVGCPRKDLCV